MQTLWKPLANVVFAMKPSQADQKQYSSWMTTRPPGVYPLPHAVTVPLLTVAVSVGPETQQLAAAGVGARRPAVNRQGTTAAMATARKYLGTMADLSK